jgi:hypothetical protein
LSHYGIINDYSGALFEGTVFTTAQILLITTNWAQLSSSAGMVTSLWTLASHVTETIFYVQCEHNILNMNV